MLFGLIKTNKDKKIESLEKEVETLEKEVTELKLQSSMESPFKVSVNTGKVVTLKKSVLLLLDEPYDMVEEEIARGFEWQSRWRAFVNDTANKVVEK